MIDEDEVRKAAPASFVLESIPIPPDTQNINQRPSGELFRFHLRSESQG